MPEATTVICVVEDDPRVRRAITRLLRTAQYVVEAFESAEAFLRHPHREACRCLILDIDLPGKNGHELAETLTAAKNHIPTIFISAREPRAGNTCSGGVAWLTKPFEADALFAAIQDALARTGNFSAC